MVKANFIKAYDTTSNFVKHEKVQELGKAVATVGRMLVLSNSLPEHSKNIKRDNLKQLFKIRKAYENNEISQHKANQIGENLGIKCEIFKTNKEKCKVVQQEENIYAVKINNEYTKQVKESKKKKLTGSGKILQKNKPKTSIKQVDSSLDVENN